MAEVKCSKCQETLDSTFDFYWTADEKRQNWCKECMKAYTKAWHKKKRDKINLLREKRYAEMRA